jgi:hypothetical protein
MSNDSMSPVGTGGVVVVVTTGIVDCVEPTISVAHAVSDVALSKRTAHREKTFM